MSGSSRRSVLRSGAGLALGTTIAGCFNSSDGIAKASSEIPGVEDGDVVDPHAFASAHDTQLSSRSGTLTWTRVELDGETGETVSNSVWTVRVEGERVRAVIAGDTPLAGGTQIAESDTTRLEFYFSEGPTVYSRRKTDEGWKTQSTEQVALGESTFTGKADLETQTLTKVGTEPVDGKELYRFSNATRAPDDERVRWASVQVLANRDALVHSFHATSDGTTRPNRESQRVAEWHLTGLDSTTVDRPEWVSEADG